MNTKKRCCVSGKTGLVLGAVILGTLNGCVAYVDSPRHERVVVEEVVMVGDEYVYYPRYNVYYNRSRRNYICQERGSWVTLSSPRGVSLNLLFSSPSVRMDFHDSPQRHHNVVVKKYPRNWSSGSSHHEHRR